MTHNRTEREPTFEAVVKVLMQRFWILTAILFAANTLFVVVGKQLVEAKFRDYMDKTLAGWKEQTDKAKADASAASLLAYKASESAGKAIGTVADLDSKIDVAKSKADAVATRLDKFDAQSTALSDLGLQINQAKILLENQQAFANRIQTIEANLDTAERQLVETNRKLSDSIRVESFTIGQPEENGSYDRRPMSGSQEWAMLKTSDWRHVATYGTIVNTGFAGKNSWAMMAGASEFKCNTDIEDDHYKTTASGEFYNWGDDGGFRTKVRIYAIFARK